VAHPGELRLDHEKMKSFSIGEAANSGLRRMKLEHLVNDISTLAGRGTTYFKK
jgi:hypothetical protein